jgi:hypothetical protein
MNGTPVISTWWLQGESRRRVDGRRSEQEPNHPVDVDPGLGQSGIVTVDPTAYVNDVLMLAAQAVDLLLNAVAEKK